MPPPSTHPSLHLQVLPDPFFVVQMQAGDALPPCVVKDITHGITGGGGAKFFSVTRTNEEISLVGEAGRAGSVPEGVREAATWMGIKIAGPMQHSLTGVLADFSAPLKAAKVPIFAMSTWNTDYVLVPTGMLTDAINALEKDGWVFVQGNKNRVARL